MDDPNVIIIYNSLNIFRLYSLPVLYISFVNDLTLNLNGFVVHVQALTECREKGIKFS